MAARTRTGQTVGPAARWRTQVAAASVGLVVAVLGTSCAGDPWTTVVISNDHHLVCTAQLDARNEPGGATPCFGPSEVPGALEVGDCVQLAVHHPETTLEKQVQCPEATPSTVPESDLVDVPANCLSLAAAARLSPTSTAAEAAANIRRFGEALQPDLASERYFSMLLAAVEQMPPDEAVGDSLDDLPCAD